MVEIEKARAEDQAALGKASALVVVILRSGLASESHVAALVPSDGGVSCTKLQVVQSLTVWASVGSRKGLAVAQLTLAGEPLLVEWPGKDQRTPAERTDDAGLVAEWMRWRVDEFPFPAERSFIVRPAPDVPGQWIAARLDQELVTQGDSPAHAAAMMVEASEMVEASLGPHSVPLGNPTVLQLLDAAVGITREQRGPNEGELGEDAVRVFGRHAPELAEREPDRYMAALMRVGGWVVLEIARRRAKG